MKLEGSICWQCCKRLGQHFTQRFDAAFILWRKVKGGGQKEIATGFCRGPLCPLHCDTGVGASEHKGQLQPRVLVSFNHCLKALLSWEKSCLQRSPEMVPRALQEGWGLSRVMALVGRGARQRQSLQPPVLGIFGLQHVLGKRLHFLDHVQATAVSFPSWSSPQEKREQ